MSRRTRSKAPSPSMSERLGAVTGRLHVVAGLLQERRQDVPKSTVVVNQQNAAVAG